MRSAPEGRLWSDTSRTLAHQPSQAMQAAVADQDPLGVDGDEGVAGGEPGLHETEDPLLDLAL